MNLRTRGRATSVVAALALLGALVAPTQVIAATDPVDTTTILEKGHIDAFHVSIKDDGSVRLALSDDATASHLLRTPESVKMVVKDASQTTFKPTASVPEDLKGQTVYRLPLSQNPNLIWPGWDTNGMKDSFGPNAAVDYEVEATGPGDIWMWQQDEEGTVLSVLADGALKLNPTGTIHQGFPGHTHTNWAFSEPGTYSLEVTAQVTSELGNATSNTATYTFVVAPSLSITGTQDSYTEDSQIALSADGDVVGGTYRWSIDGTTVPEQTGSQLLLNADTELNGASVTVDQIGSVGTVFATSSPVLLNIVEPTPEQTIAIKGLAHHYHQGSFISLEIETNPAIESGLYEWFMQRKDQNEPSRMDQVTGSTFLTHAEQALDGAVITANLLSEDGSSILASAEPVVLSVNDHGDPAFNIVMISGLRDQYQIGESIDLTASVNPVSYLKRYQWEIKTAVDSEWRPIDGENSSAYSLEATEDLRGAQVRAVLTYNDGARYVVSDPVTLNVNTKQPVETVLSITGLQDTYDVDQVANLTAVQTPPSEEDHYHWFIKRGTDTDYKVIPGAATENLAYTITEEDNSATIIAKLYNHGHEVLAESAPVALTVNTKQPVDPTLPEAQKPSLAPAVPDAKQLEEVAAGGITLDKSSAKAGETVTIKVDSGIEEGGKWIAAWHFSTPTLLGGDWLLTAADGTVKVQIPLDTKAGDHRIAVFDRNGSLLGWQPISITAAPTPGTGDKPEQPKKPAAQMPATGAAISPLLIGGAAMLIVVGAALVLSRRRSDVVDR